MTVKQIESLENANKASFGTLDFAAHDVADSEHNQIKVYMPWSIW